MGQNLRVWWRRQWRAMGRLAGQRGKAVVVVFIATFAGAALLGLIAGIPEPRIPDENSYLLAADTFAQGRLTNPTHPLWLHFENFGVIQRPTYMSKYGPAPALFLAAGQLIGHPVIGVWLSAAGMCAAILWMFQAWVSPRWALFGAVLVMLKIGVVGYWSQSYWGGAVPALGGALMFGGMRRLLGSGGPKVRHTVLMCIGVAILANSRYLIGFVSSVPVAVALVLWMLRGRSRPAAATSLRTVILPTAIVLGVVAAGMGYYNKCITGDPLRLPYLNKGAPATVADRLIATTFSGKAGESRHAMMDKFREQHEGRRRGDIRARMERFVHVRMRAAIWCVSHYLGLVLIVPLLMLPLTLTDRWMRFALLVVSLVALALMSLWVIFEHYLSPVTGLIYLFVVQGVRRLQLWRHRFEPTWRIGAGLILALSVVWYLGTAMVWTVWLRGPGAQDWPMQRKRLIQKLEQMPGRDLVLIRYHERQKVLYEWLRNPADIDAQPVVLAREMDLEKNRELVEYYHNRKAWLLSVHNNVQKLEPYTYQPLPPEPAAQTP